MDVEITEKMAAELRRMDEFDRKSRQILAGPETNRKIAEKFDLADGRYSESWDDAMSLVEKLRTQWGFELMTIESPILLGRIRSERRWKAKFFDGEPIIANGVGDVMNYSDYYAFAATGPLAICRATLLIP